MILHKVDLENQSDEDVEESEAEGEDESSHPLFDDGTTRLNLVVLYQ